jgi:hypothetical protein
MSGHRRSSKLKGNLQDLIHLIKSLALGLRKEEERPDGGEHHPRGEEEPCPVPKGPEDVREGFGDDELDEPEMEFVSPVRDLFAGIRVYHCTRAAHVPVRFRSAPGKISADTIHGIPFRPNDQL